VVKGREGGIGPVNLGFYGLEFLGLLMGFFQGSYFGPFGRFTETEEALIEERTSGHKDIIKRDF
jgi:hypothetical protein